MTQSGADRKPASRLRLLSSSKCFGGMNRRYEYDSELCQAPLKLSIFFPPAAERRPVPVVYYLASMTTDDLTFLTQAGAQRKAAQLGLALVCSDSSPRDIPGIEPHGDEWPFKRFGYANSWYLDSTVERYRNWQMRSWIASELPGVLREHFPRQLDTGTASVLGFSMGGSGALTLGLTHPQQFRCISAFAPICTPASSALGPGYFAEALGPDPEAWRQYDAVALLQQYTGPHMDILIEKGSLEEYSVVNPEVFAEHASKNPHVSCTYREQEGYGHSFAFVATFVDEHLEWHWRHLSRPPTEAPA